MSDDTKISADMTFDLTVDVERRAFAAAMGSLRSDGYVLSSTPRPDVAAVTSALDALRAARKAERTAITDLQATGAIRDASGAVEVSPFGDDRQAAQDALLAALDAEEA